MRPTSCVSLICAVLAGAAVSAGCHTRHVVGEQVGPEDGDAAGPGPDAPTPPDGGDVPAPIQPCGAFVPGPDLAVCSASYLGGPGRDVVGNVAVAPGGTVVIGGTFAGTSLQPTTLIEGEGGLVLRLSADGTRTLSATGLGTAVHDLVVDAPRGRLLVLGEPYGLASLSLDGRQLHWQKPAVGTRLSVGTDGTVAVLDTAKAQLALFAADGAAIGSGFTATGTTPTSVAVFSPSNLVILTGAIVFASGWRQPFLYAYSYAGDVKWRAYGWRETEATQKSLTANTRGLRVTIGLDNRLYYLGESHGGNTTHQKHPRRLEEAADVVVTDDYTFTYNTSHYVMFFARFRPETGALERGQFVLTRERQPAPADGRSVFGGAIAVDETGHVLLGGRLGCCMEDSELKTVRGLPASGGSEPEAFVMLVSPDFKKRLLWTSFGKASGSDVVGVAMREGVAAMVAQHTGRLPLITHQPLQPSSAGGSAEGYFAVWPAP